MQTLQTALDRVWYHSWKRPHHTIGYDCLREQLIVPYHLSRQEVKLLVKSLSSDGITVDVRRFWKREKEHRRAMVRKRRRKQQKAIHIKRRLQALSYNRNDMGIFLHQMGTYPVLSQTQVVLLMIQYEKGNLKARNYLVKCNIRLVIAIAKKYRNSYISFGDLVQMGVIGLFTAIYNFDYRLGYKFSTYAYNWIRQGITRGIANQGRTIRLPVKKTLMVNRMRYLRTTLTQKLKRRPNNAELAKALHISKRKLRTLQNLDQDMYSLDAQVKPQDGKFNQDATMGNFIKNTNATSPEQAVDKESLHNSLMRLIQNLSVQQQYVICAGFGLVNGKPMKYVDIARHLGVSYQRVQQVKKEALMHLRESPQAKGLKQYFLD